MVLKGSLTYQDSFAKHPYKNRALVCKRDLVIQSTNLSWPSHTHVAFRNRSTEMWYTVQYFLCCVQLSSISFIFEHDCVCVCVCFKWGFVHWSYETSRRKKEMNDIWWVIQYLIVRFFFFVFEKAVCAELYNKLQEKEKEMQEYQVMCVAWLIYICDTTYACMWHDVCCMTHSYMWHDSCLYVTYFNQTCVWHVSSIRLASIIQICDMMHALDRKKPPPPRGGFLFTMFPHQEPWGARSKWRGFSPAATARHSQQARVHTDSRQEKKSQKFQVTPVNGR